QGVFYGETTGKRSCCGDLSDSDAGRVHIGTLLSNDPPRGGLARETLHHRFSWLCSLWFYLALGKNHYFVYEGDGKRKGSAHLGRWRGGSQHQCPACQRYAYPQL